MKIISFNILSDLHINFNNIANEEYAGMTDKELRMKTRYPTIVKFLKAENPDIILLQEVTEDVRIRMIKDFRDYTIPNVSYHSDYASGNMTMFKKAIKMDDHQTIYHVKGGVYDVIFFHDDFIVANIHLNDVNGNIRNSEISYLLNNIVKNKKNVIIGGDFNTDSSFSHRKLLHHGFTSAAEPRRAQSPGTYLCDPAIIDYIYVRWDKPIKISGYIFKGSCENVCHKSCLSIIGSDHYPIIGIISFI